MFQPEQQCLFQKPEATGTNAKRLGQYMTPRWAARALVKRHFPNLSPGDVALEMTCGDGAFLSAFPEDVVSIGIEIDPVLAAQARARTGRRVITGDFRDVRLDVAPQVVAGNPPFSTDIIDALLERAHALLPMGGQVGLVLPAYALQTAGRVVRYARAWSIEAEMLPRTLFPGLHCPLSWVNFVKDGASRLCGMSLYFEAYDIAQMPDSVQRELNATSGKWRDVVRRAVSELGGRATLEEVYRSVEPRRPSDNPWWKEKVRQSLGRYCTRLSKGVYELPPEAMAA